jgi:pimeloyl-ACP methyl ester carboxylesterase
MRCSIVPAEISLFEKTANHALRVIAALLALVAAAPSASAQALALADCRIDAGTPIPTVEAECGILEVPENRDDPDSKSIELHVALVPALNVEPLPDPLVVIAGGPGQSSIDFYLSFRQAFEKVQRNRPILLVDQRGTGRSNLMSCPVPEDITELESFEPERIVEVTRACLDALDGDPRYYTTSVAVRDLDAVRDALGFAELNIYGVSYGTRVALHYARRYPERTRTLVIDGVVPADLILGPAIATDAQSTLDRLFSRCAESAACRGALGDIEAKFAELRARLAAEPVTTTVSHPRTGEIVEKTVSDLSLAGMVRLHSYSPATQALLPLMISEAHAGRYGLLAAQVLLIEQGFEDALAMGMHNAVMCTEDAPFFGRADVDTAEVARSYLGARQLEYLATMCSVWPSGVIDDGFKAPLQTDIPVLLLSGELDPVTPPSYAEHAKESLTNAVHIVAPNQGHGVAGTGCIPRLFDEFVTEASAAAIDPEDECIERLGGLPFFLSPTGPAP